MYLIIGLGAAGATAANELRKLDSKTPITVITKEPEGFYSRIDLPDIISGKCSLAEARLQSLEQLQLKNIHCIVGEQAVKISPAEHSVTLDSGQILNYSKLLIATGAQPMIPKLPGFDAQGVYVLWTLAQTADLLAAASEARSAVVIGAGLIGLKIALALRQQGIKVTVLEREERIMAQRLDETGAAILEGKLTQTGLEILTAAQVEAVTVQAGTATGVQVKGQLIMCDMVIAAIGVRPVVDLAKEAKLAVDRGIITDLYLQTSKTDIYAAGDVAEVMEQGSFKTVLSAGWPEAVRQGIIAARNMSGFLKMEYEGYLTKNSVELAGVPLVSVGNVSGEAEDKVLTFRSKNVYKRFVIKENYLNGFLLMGDIRQAGVLTGAIISKREMDYEAAVKSDFNFVHLLGLEEAVYANR